jgi:MATE family multidrug resistance protein
MQPNNWVSRAGGVLRLAWPLVLSATSTMLMQFADAVFLGSYSADALAAVTPAGIWVFLWTALAQGPVSYVSTFIAQAKGAGKPELGLRFAWQGIWLALALGFLLTLCTPWMVQVFSWADHPAAVVQQEVVYTEVLLRFSWISLLSQACTAIYVGQGKTRLVGILQFVAFWVNALLDWLLIFGNGGCPALGIQGAAIGTVAATALPPLVLGWMFARSARSQITGPDRTLIGRLCRYGFAEGLRLFSDVGIWTVFAFVLGRLGTEALTANNLVIRITSLVWLPLYGLGRATGQLVGVAVGAQQESEARRTAWTGASLGVVWSVLWGLAMAIAPLFFLGWFPIASTDLFRDSVFETAGLLLIWASLLGVFDAFNMVVQGGFLGAGDSRWTMRTIACVHAGMLVALLFADGLGASAAQFWLIACLDQIVLSSFLLKRLRSRHWLQHNLTYGLGEPLSLLGS